MVRALTLNSTASGYGRDRLHCRGLECLHWLLSCSASAALSAVLLLLIGLSVGVSRWHVSAAGMAAENNALVYHQSFLVGHLLRRAVVDSWVSTCQVNGRGTWHAFWLPLFLTDMPAFALL